MATVARTSTLRARIDRYLDYLSREWQTIPEVDDAWDGWSEDDRLDFVVEWPIREDRLHQLQQWAEQGLLTPMQCDRYEQLLDVVARHRPTVEALLSE